jgi:DNA topoisomerase-2
MSSTSKTLEEKYQKKTQIEHVLDRPDTYVDSIKIQEDMMDIFDDDLQKVIRKNIKFVPALYKIFDEIIVNAFDHTKTDSTCDTIKVTIDKEKNEISVFNNGKGVDVEIHPTHKIYVPELIFGELLTSTNYDDKEERTTGGRNGYGAKLTNIFSSKFIVETVDEERKKKFYQEFSENMGKRTKAKVTDYKLKSYTQITFTPDLKRFGLEVLTDDIVGLFKKRVYDIAGLGEKLKVYYNEKKIEANNFKKYITLYYPDEDVFYDETERWKVGVIYKPDNNFEQKSFVNGICTYKGGSHVEYVMKGIIKKVKDAILKKNKDLKIKDEVIKENLVIFIDSTIINPAFSSQTKEELKTKQAEFGSLYEMNDKVVTKILKSGIVELIIEVAKNKEKAVLKGTDGKKTNNIKGIPKLEDAEWAGTKKSIQCRLILTEGDSAKGLAMAGRSAVIEGNCKYGVFPLKGKLLNVREATAKQLLENEEIINIKKILGLQHNKEYTNVSELRYSSIIVLTDQDCDGYHIKGLVMNFFHYFFPSLVKLNFIHSLATPIVKAIKGKDTRTFYNLTEYEAWKGKIDTHLWHIKYYKGLGTSNREEAKEYFSDLENKLVKYTWNEKSHFSKEKGKKVGDSKEESDGEEESITSSKKSETKGTKKLKTTTVEDTNKEHICYDAITLAFEKKRSDDRKDWLMKYDRTKILQNDLKEIPIFDFVHRELIHFSNDDIIRSIPSVIDGFKPSQRKVQYGTVLRKLNRKQDEIKVAQLSGYISEKTSYHHGEASLQGTIVGMAQNFVGSNNLNLLHPSGQLGTRLLGGRDAASPRYIFTYLEEWNRNIFRPEDDPILNYLNDDGQLIEPEFYVPIIPMILVNGAQGIGTGFSTTILQYNPIQLIDNILLMMETKSIKEMLPYYRGFKGKVEKAENGFNLKGIYRIDKERSVVIVTELPIGTWTTNYKEHLDKLEEDKIIKGYKDKNTDETIYFEIQFTDDNLFDLIEKKKLEATLKLCSKETITNMHCFNKNSVIRKYETIYDILREFYDVRLEYYRKRKQHQINELEKELNVLDWKMKFIKGVIDGTIVVNNQSKEKITDQLEKLEFPKLSENKSYDYLVQMPIYSLSKEKIDELQKKIDNLEEELAIIEKTTEIERWKMELLELKKIIEKIYKASEALLNGDDVPNLKGKVKINL